MKRSDSLSLVAVFLLVFLVVVGVTIWLLDFVTQQRVFGLLVGAEFIAFALLVYLYYEETPAQISRKLVLTGFVALAALVLLAAALLVGVGAPATPNVQVTLYSGEVSATEYGFGYSSSAITSPGPTLTFRVGDVVNLTLFNAGSMPHNWALTNTNQTLSLVLFHAQIGSGANPIEVNQSESVVFSVTQAGNFSYVCQIPGHVQVGMWGSVIINP